MHQGALSCDGPGRSGNFFNPSPNVPTGSWQHEASTPDRASTALSTGTHITATSQLVSCSRGVERPTPGHSLVRGRTDCTEYLEVTTIAQSQVQGITSCRAWLGSGGLLKVPSGGCWLSPTRLGVRFASQPAHRGSGRTLVRGVCVCVLQKKGIATLPSSNSIWQHTTILRQHESLESEPATEVADLGLGAAARARKNEVCGPAEFTIIPLYDPRGYRCRVARVPLASSPLSR